MTREQDLQFMKRALELAANGRGSVSPNPMVGCVIVHEGIIIGEGWHQAYGESHAEVNAIAQVKNDNQLSESTCYVTLEPCSHYGQTPPCADLLIEKKLSRVVIGCKDSNPLVGGKGIEKLKKNGLSVQVGVLENECRQLNIRFFRSLELGRPYVILKWAETRDGFIARKNFDSKWISGEESRSLVHQWRAEEDAIMVGTNTAKHDNPRLNVRGRKGRNPVRVVIDKGLKLDHALHLFDNSQPTIVYNFEEQLEAKQVTFVKVGQENFIQNILIDLFQRRIQSVIVEGGSTLINSFLDLNLWDEARVFVGNKTFEEGIEAPKMAKSATEVSQIETDNLSIYHNE